MFIHPLYKAKLGFILYYKFNHTTNCQITIANAEKKEN